MIASFSNKFIFIKTRKTAGTSVEIVLSGWCAEHDIVTPVAPPDELIRREYKGLPRNFKAPPDQERAYIEAVRSGDFSEIERLHAEMRRGLRRSGFFGHMPASAVKQRLPDFWEDAFKFTIERHPYEKVVSRAFWWTFSHGDTRPIGEIIEDVIEDRRLSDRFIYADDAQVLVDKVINYDHLWTEIGTIAKSMGRSLPDPLPRSKGGTRTDRRPAREVLTIDQRRRITERCAFEFELMGFEI